MRRRQFLKYLGCSSLLALSGVHYFDTYDLRVSRVELRLNPQAKLPVRVLHLSDMHYQQVSDLSFLKYAVMQGLAEKPDLILLTGDLITTRFPEQTAF